MGGPFMQGIVLLGIIYWYSKGMLSLINDYYRSEFHQKLKRAPPEQKIHQMQPQSYDLDDMEQLIKMESLKEMTTERMASDMDDNGQIRWNASEEVFKEFHAAAADDAEYCYTANNKIQFLNILLQLHAHLPIHGQLLYIHLNYPMCYKDDKKKQ